MGRLRAKNDYESLRNARISQIKSRIASLGVRSSGPEEPPAIISSGKSIKRVKHSDSATPLRRSGRLKGKSCDDSDSSSPQEPQVEDDYDERSLSDRLKAMCSDSGSSPPQVPKVEGKDFIENELGVTVDDHDSSARDYESLRNARISENKARMASLGLERRIRELQDVVSSAKSNKTIKKSKPLVTPTRRSERLKGVSVTPDASSPLDLLEERDSLSASVRRSLFPNSYRCASKARGSIYDPVFGICCHFCRQKKLCGEEDCKRCGDRDLNQPCIGKTECSVCHSSNGILCRACLKVRYGEEMEEVRKDKNWMCPHCIEAKGTRPHWICNSSFCMKKRKMIPTGIAIYHAREAGYESVAHLIMDKLKRKADYL